MKFLDDEQRQSIGFNYVLDKIQTTTAYGNIERKNIKPYKREEKEQLLNEYKLIKVVRESLDKNKYIFNDIGCLFCKIKDIRGTITRLETGEILDEVEIFEIKNFAYISNDIRVCYKKLNINLEGMNIQKLEDVIAILDPENKKVPTFYLYDSYSEKLKNIRSLKRNIENEMISSCESKDLKALKEKRLSIVVMEEQEEKNVRKQICKKLMQYVKPIRENMYFIGKLDLLIAKAKIGGVMPNIVEEQNVEFVNAYNPQVKEILENDGKEFTCINIALSSGTTVLTGANMGGKSITIKTVVLNLMLAMCGMYVFAEKGTFPMMDFVYFISDDLQNVSKGLSTFGAEIIKVQQALNFVKEQTGFLALDEFARGTNPVEGKNLVKALACYLNKFQSFSFISTHYDGVVSADMVHYQVKGLKNVDFERLKNKIDLNVKDSVKIIQENMNYGIERVTTESKVPKDALNICELLRLDNEVVTLAQNFYENKESGDRVGK